MASSDDSTKALERAALLIDSHQSKDDKFPELWDLLTTTDANDYTSDPLPLFQKQTTGVIPLPEPLIELYTQSLECTFFMGLFPEIKRAWMTIDEQLCIWNYEDTRDFQTYTGLSQLIMSVALVKPKKGVFAPEVEWLVALSTPVEVVLLAVVVGANGLVTLMPTHLSAATPTSMVKLQGAQDGRIFMAGKDGNLYEFEYRAAPGFFSSICAVRNKDAGWAKRHLVPPIIKTYLAPEDPMVDISIDGTRNILYTLSKNNSIGVYDIAADRVSRVTKETEVSRKMLAVPQHAVRPENLRIVSIVAIPSTESAYIHLMALTSTGARLYFTTYAQTAGVKPEPSSTPHTLNLVFTRAPPLSYGDRERALSDIEIAFYSRGTLLMAEPRLEENEALVCISPDTAAICRAVEQTSESAAAAYQKRPRLVERAITLSAESRTLAIAEVPRKSADQSPNSLNELATQHVGGPRQFLYLTSKGMEVIVQLRPVDQLSSLLAANRDEDVVQFFERYGPAQGCAMALHLACLGTTSSSKSISSPVMENAARVFFKYLGKPQMDSQRDTRAAPYYGAPAQALGGMGAALSTPTFNPSYGHTGFAFFLSRLIRPIWSHYISDIISTSSSPVLVGPEILATIEISLAALFRFIKRTPQFTQFQRDRIQDVQYLQNKEDAIKTEQRSLSDMCTLLERALDAVRLLEILGPTIGQVLPKFPKEQRDTILRTRFRDMVISTNGADVAKTLIDSMIALFTEQNQDIEMLCGKLAEKSPSFFSTKERTRIKADDLLRRVGSSLADATSDIVIYTQKLELLSTALKLYLSIVPDFNISNVCTTFRKLGYYSGVVELAVAYARAADPNNLALAHYREESRERREADLVSKEIYDKCVNAYQTVVEVLDELNSPPKEGADNLKNEVLAQALKVDDELLQHTIFQWFVDRGRSDELLQLNNSKYLPRFLARANEELLAQYHVKNSRHADAAVIYATVAEKGPGPLTTRLSLLSRALACIQCAGLNNDFATELNDKLDVAIVQLTIYDQLPDSPYRRELDEQLVGLSKLYNAYAKPSHLLESQLEIIRLAKHVDPPLVQSLWDAIINRELEQSSRTLQLPAPSPSSAIPLRQIQLPQFVAVVQKVATTARKLNRADNVFPLSNLLGKLEGLALEAGDTQGTVVKALHNDAETPYQSLWEAYKDILRNPSWQKPRAKTHILSVLTTLLEEWANTSKVDYTEQQQFNALKVDSAIDELLSDLNTMPTADAGACEARLRALRRVCVRLPTVPRLLW